MTNDKEMNCLAFRQHRLTDPADSSAELLAHEADCDACRQFAADRRRQDELIREAASVAVPEGFAARIQLNQSLQSKSRRPTRWYWLSLAASLLVAALVLPTLFETPDTAFASQLVTHTNAHAVLKRGQSAWPAAPGRVASVLTDSATAVPASTDNILYASTCVIDGEAMAHLLVRDDTGDYVVYIIPKSAPATGAFIVDTWQGQIAAVDGHHVAIMSNREMPSADVTRRLGQQFARRYQDNAG